MWFIGNKTPEKIAVLGGGISSLAGVFDLTSEKNWQRTVSPIKLKDPTTPGSRLFSLLAI